MRKIYLAIASCVALVAFMGFSATSYAVIDPACEPDNEFGITGFTIDSTDTHRGYAVSGITGTGLACGSRATVAGSYENGGSGSQFVRADISVPPGVKINSTAGMEQGAYVGQAVINALTWAGTPFIPIFIDGDEVSDVSVLTVDNSEGTDCTADAVACYRGDLDATIVKAHNWNWVTGDEASGYTLTIGELYNDLAPASPAGLTKIREFSLCDYTGDVPVPSVPSSRNCGDGSDPTQFLQKNGDPWVFLAAGLLPVGGDRARPVCPGGLGLYTVTATTRGSSLDPKRTTDQVESCVAWTGIKWFKAPPFGTPPNRPDIGTARPEDNSAMTDGTTQRPTTRP